MSLLFVGTGTSSGIPSVHCLTENNCAVCTKAMRGQTARDAVRWGSRKRPLTDAEESDARNYRSNTCLLLRLPNKNILIDCGKFFWHAAMRAFPAHKISQLSAVILTHDHVDAYGGLDDLRDFTWHMDHPLDLYASDQHSPAMRRSFPWALQRGMATGGGQVPTLALHEFPLRAGDSFFADGVEFVVIPLCHGLNRAGGDYLTTAFRFLFTRDGTRLLGGVVYAPDCSRIPDESRLLMEDADVLILDALRPNKVHLSHFTVGQAVEEADRLRAKTAYLTGACHYMDHHHTCMQLRDGDRKLGIRPQGEKVQLAYDGLEVRL